jgi:hypothetical protein
MSDVSGIGNTEEASSRVTPGTQGGHKPGARIDRRELRIIVGAVVLLFGVSLLIGTLISPPESYSLEGWLVIVASAISAVGIMLSSSGLAARQVRFGIWIFVATPGILVAAVAFAVRAFLLNFNNSFQYFNLGWTVLSYFGILWAIASPILVHRSQTRLRVIVGDQDSEKEEFRRLSAASGKSSGLIIATWSVAFAALLAPVIDWLLRGN